MTISHFVFIQKKNTIMTQNTQSDQTIQHSN